MPILSMVTNVEKSDDTWIFFRALPVGEKVCRASPVFTSHHWPRDKERKNKLLECFGYLMDAAVHDG